MRLLPTLLALALITAPPLAGCLGEDAPPPPPPATNQTAEPRVATFQLACPPGETTERIEGVCVGTIADPTESYQEVVAASDPGNGTVAIAAIGVQAPPANTQGPAESRIVVFTSDDGGGSWQRAATVPSPMAVSAQGMFDPSLAYRGDRLHLNAMWTPHPGSADEPTRIRDPEMYHVASKDPAEGWGSPTLITEDRDNDRGWITTGPAGTTFIAWKNYGDSSTELAWKLAGQDAWQRQEPERTVTGCGEHTPVVVLNGTPYLGCVAEGDGQGMPLFAFDAATGDLEEVARIDEAGPPDRSVRPRMVKTTDDRLILAAPGPDGAALLAKSPDGRSWSEPVDLFELVSVDDGWPDPSIWAMAADPWGNVHLVIRSTQQTTALAADQPAHELAHVALDPLTGEILAEQMLARWDPQDPSADRSMPTLAPTAPDDTAGIAFLDGRGMVFWHYDKAIDYTVLEPVGRG